MNSNLDIKENPKKETILVIDDTHTNLKLVSDFLGKSGFEVQIAKSGFQALKILDRALPDLILLDIMMPEMDGFETCRRLKAWEKTKDIPVIFMTAIADFANPENKVKGLTLGAVDYISKPVQLDEVLARVRTHLHLRSLAQQLSEQNTRLREEIEERKQVEEQLRKSEERWQLALQGNNDGVWDWNIKTNETFRSSRFIEILGYEDDEIGNSNDEWITRIHPDDVDRVMKANQDYLDKKKPYYAVEHRLRCKDGIYKWVLSRGQAQWDEVGKPVRMVGSTSDITTRKQAEESLKQSEAREREKAQTLELTLKELQRTQAQLIQAEKMSSLGRMVGGIAHEINNPVSFIYGNLKPAREYFQDLLRLIELYQQTYPNPTPEIRQFTETIDLEFLVEDWSKLMHSMQVGVERISQIVRSLKSFSRQDEAELKPVDIHEGIDNTLLILQNRLRAEGSHQAIEVIKNYGQLPLITCYVSQLNQVFMNLFNNAIDVLENQPAPRVITISTSMLTKEPTTPNSQFAVIQITDNGPGMSEEVRQRMFDPFFTTKPVGTGTGLGLAISHQIVVEKHLGQIRCISTPGQGTQMIVEIPVSF